MQSALYTLISLLQYNLITSKRQKRKVEEYSIWSVPLFRALIPKRAVDAVAMVQYACHGHRDAADCAARDDVILCIGTIVFPR